MRIEFFPVIIVSPINFRSPDGIWVSSIARIVPLIFPHLRNPFERDSNSHKQDSLI